MPNPTPSAPGSAEASEKRRCCCLHHSEDCDQTRFAFKVLPGSVRCGCGWLTEGAKYFCGQRPPPSAPDAGRDLLGQYQDAENRVAFYHREIIRTEGDPAACDRAELARRVADAARTKLLDRFDADAATLAALRQENEALRARVGELLDVTSAVEYGDLPSAGPWPYVQGMCREMLGEQPTEPQPRTVNAIRLRLGLPLSARWPQV